MPVALVAAGASLLGGYLQGQSAEDAARTQAAGQTEAARLAAEEARFRPVGITTRFGQSQFTTGPDGRVSGAGYTLSPELRAYQDRLMGLTGGGLSQAEQAQQQFAPLAQGAQGLFGLGQQYLAQSPEAAAQQYMAGQQNLLAPSRERQLAQLQNQLFQTGRGGLSVGATGERPSGAAGLGATTPEMEAYYNAIAQQDAGLAAQAMQAGQQQTAFGAGLLGTGGNLLTQGYGGQVAAIAVPVLPARRDWPGGAWPSAAGHRRTARWPDGQPHRCTGAAARRYGCGSEPVRGQRLQPVRHGAVGL